MPAPWHGRTSSRLTHSHPGRVVWLLFNVAIALLLMELGIYTTNPDNVKLVFGSVRDVILRDILRETSPNHTTNLRQCH